MTRKDQDKKWFMGRASMIGDSLAALVTARFVKKFYPDDHVTWAIGKKCTSFAPLLLNHPDLDKIFTTDGAEGLESERDFKEFNSCDYKFNLNPQHPDNLYPSQRNIYLESFLMAGFNNEEWDMMSEDDKIPKLIKWWNPVKRPFGDKKTIFVVGFPNFNTESKRSVSKRYLEELILKLVEHGYCVIQSGGEQDPIWFSDWDKSEGFPVNNSNYKRVNEMSFFQQIQIANECSCVLGNDSGMTLVCGAYNLQIVSLLTLHWGNMENPSALTANNSNNFSFYSMQGTDNIDMNLVIDKINEKVKS